MIIHFSSVVAFRLFTAHYLLVSFNVFPFLQRHLVFPPSVSPLELLSLFQFLMVLLNIIFLPSITPLAHLSMQVILFYFSFFIYHLSSHCFSNLLYLFSTLRTSAIINFLRLSITSLNFLFLSFYFRVGTFFCNLHHHFSMFNFPPYPRFKESW